MRFYIYAGGSWQSVLFTADSSFDITQWHHYTGTWDGTNLKIYVDGVLKNTSTPTGSINTSDTNNLNICVWDSYLNGSIGEVVIYNRAISADEVRKRSSSRFKYAIARDAQGTPQAGIQSGDKVIITFDAPTAGTSISSIATALSLSSSHVWGTIQSAVWSTTTYTNDTLTVTLSTTGSPTVAVGDTITLGTTIKDTFNRALTGSIVLGGNFGVNLPTGGIAYYNFDEQSGTTTYDSIGNNHGTLNNSFWRTERIFKGLYFDGSRSVQVSDSPDFNLSSYTIDAWVKVPDGLNSSGSFRRRIIEQSDGTNFWRMELNEDRLQLCDKRLTMSSTSNECINTATTIDDGEWHHLAVVHDDAANTVKLYIDGVALVTDTATGGGTPHNIGANVLIGMKYTISDYFYGMIDEIVVYNRVLTTAEIQSRYRAPLKSAFTSDIYFNSGIQSGDKVIIRFHGKTNGYASIDSTNIGTNLSLSSSHTWGTIQSAVWSTYNGITNNTLTVTLGSSTGTIAGGDTITVNTTSGIKDIFGNNISDTATLSRDFDFNLPEGAISYWKLDETSGTTAYDSFGTNNGTLYNSPTWTSGKFNNALNFTGGTGTDADYVQVNNSYSINPERITVEAWAKSGGATWNNYGTIVSKRDAYILHPVSASKNMQFYIYAGGAWQSVTFTADGSFDITQWHHYVGTYDGSNIKIYVDGVLKTTTAYTGVINITDTGVLTIGRDDGLDRYLNGSIDDAAVYNRALTADEVLGRYGDYTVTALARDASNGGPGIQAGDTVKISFSGPTNGAAISASNIETALALSNAHYWRNNSGLITSAVWNSTGGNENDTLTVTLASFETTLPDVAPQDTITIGSPIGSKYRAFTKSAKIGGLFGDNLPASGNKVAYYNFNEQGGTTAYDSIGSNHGTLNNSFWRTEQTFKGLYFDGGRYVDVPDSPDFNLSSYTI